MSSAKRSATSIFIAIAAAAIGLGFAWAAGTSGKTFNGYPVFFLCALMALGLNWLAFIPSAIAQTEKYYDLTGSLTYLAVIGTAWILAGPPDVRAIVVAAMVVIWAVRLGSFLFRRIARDGKDTRFDRIKINPARFVVAWTLQALWVIFTAAAALAIMTAEKKIPAGLFFWVGAAIWIFGFVFEVVADNQKSAFKANPDNANRFIRNGLWAWSQHPNYFGEIVLWTGIAIMAIPILSGLSWLVLLSPVFVTFLLTRVSGIAMLDAKANQRWGDNAEYQTYRQQTPVLIPRRPR